VFHHAVDAARMTVEMRNCLCTGNGSDDLIYVSSDSRSGALVRMAHCTVYGFDSVVGVTSTRTTDPELGIQRPEVRNCIFSGVREIMGVDLPWDLHNVGGFDGISESGSNLFVSVGLDFEDLGVQVGDTLNIIEPNADGLSSTNGLGGGAYTITGVGGNTLTVDTAPAAGLTLDLGNVHFSVNQVTTTVSTPINFQNFYVVSRDGYGEEVELRGIDAIEPDYSITRGSFDSHIISINNGIPSGHDAVIKTLGLMSRRCRGRIFAYNGAADDNVLRFNGPSPVSLKDVSITSVTLPNVLIADGYVWDSDFEVVSGGLVNIFGGDGYGTEEDGYLGFPGDGYLAQPTNSTIGRTLSITLNTNNIDFSGNNRILIRGDSSAGTDVEVVYSFTEPGTITTSERWLRLDNIEAQFTPINIAETAGTLGIKEHLPITQGEGNGDYAQVAYYNNSSFVLEIFGSGGLPWVLQQGFYDIDYPSFLQINVDGQPDDLIIGADFTESNSAGGVIDEFRVLREISTDTRIGESVPAGERTITTDYFEPEPHQDTDETTFLAHFDNTVEKEDRYIDAFDQGFRAASSVNTRFGRSLRIERNGHPFELSNSGGAFNNNEGTMEFWVSPTIDSRNDPNRRYYIDISSVVTEEQTSSTRISVLSNQRIRLVESVRLVTDTTNTGINYFIGGSVSNVDGKTITLGTPLPSQSVAVKITYTPLSTSGDRVSVYKDENSAISFFMRASGVDYKISTPIDWRRNTWHRIMVMWKTNSIDGSDRMRLFVDGLESGTIKYGTGLLYGDGVVYGQSEVRASAQRFIVSNIDLTDTFAKVIIGTDFLTVQNASARIDNIRFSEIQRLASLSVSGDDVIDVNYQANTDLAEPVVEDTFTSRIVNFDKEISAVEFLATVVNSERGIFRFNVDVIDSFNRVIGNERLEKLLTTLINTIKPAHTEAIINFIE